MLRRKACGRSLGLSAVVGSTRAPSAVAFVRSRPCPPPRFVPSVGFRTNAGAQANRANVITHRSWRHEVPPSQALRQGKNQKKWKRKQPSLAFVPSTAHYSSKGEEDNKPEKPKKRKIASLREILKKFAFWKHTNSKSKRSANTVYAAIASNSLIALVKAGAFLATGSATMLSEFVHSLTDVSNQALLAVGIHASNKEPDHTHPYGYGKERFVWSLISAVGVFFLGCGVTVYHGLSTLISGHALADIPVALGVLGVAFVLEGVTLYMAFKAVRDGARDAKLTVRDYIQYGSDPMSVAVLAEDAAAVAGVVVAATALLATYYTGNAVYDALGSITIGLGMGVVAILLIQRNRQLLLGTAIPPARQQTIMQILNTDPAVRAVRNIKGEIIEPGKMRFKADVVFNGEAIARRYLKSKYPKLEDTLDDIKTPEEFEAQTYFLIERHSYLLSQRFLVKYGDGIIKSLASEVDRIESQIKTNAPGAKYIDLETD